MDKLLPCPFCGGEAARNPHGDDADWYVYCPKCHIGAPGYTGAESAELWNTRLKKSILSKIGDWLGKHITISGHDGLI